MTPQALAKSLARMERSGIIIAIGASLVALVTAGWRNALGFAFGAVIAHFNFSLWRQIAGAVGGATEGKAPDNATMAFLVTRYLLIGGAVFVIMKFLDVSALPVLSGLLVTGASVLVELVWQLVKRDRLSNET